MERYDNSFNSWINQKDSIKMSEYFPKPPSDYKNIKVKIDLLIMQQKRYQ